MSFVASGLGLDGPVNFRNPPVAEVAIGFAFDRVEGLSSYLSGALLERWRSEYPNVSQQPELPPPVNLDSGPGAFFRLGPPVATRLWFAATDGGFLLQVQPDRLVANWRTGPGREYPRYPAVRERFVAAWRDVCEVASLEPRVFQTEVTYVNLTPHPLGEVLEGWSATVLFDQDNGSQTANTEATIELPNLSAPAMRRTVAQSAPSAPSQVALSVFTQVIDQTQVMVSVDLSRRHIVERFKQMTTQRMHDEWGELS